MLTLGPSIKVYLARGTTDMRKSFDTLAGAVREVLQEDPLSGHLFVFLGRRRHMIKIIYWDGSGYWVLAKRLARGTFAWPEPDDDRRAIELRPDELGALLGGVDLRRTTWRPWWRGSTGSLPPPPALPALATG
ncbi:MAG: IS66 family insertion sequence element accessory protein TnpB [Sandaracinaceae bacterium]